MPDVKIRSSCDTCLTTKVKCSQTKPACARCLQHGRECVYSQYRKIGRPSARSLGATIGRTDQLPKERVGNSGRRLKRSQHQHSPRSPDESLSRGGAPLLPASVSSDPLGSCINPSHLTNPCAIPVPKTAPRPILDELDDGDRSASSARGSALSLDRNMSDSEIAASLATGLEYGIGEVDWTALESVFDGSAPQESSFPAQQQQQHFGRVAPSSWGTQQHSPGLATPRRTPQIERLFFSLPDEHSLFGGCSAAMDGQPANDPLCQPTIASHSDLSPLGELDLFAPSTRCTSHCYAGLTSQLARISEVQAPGSNVALDVLLNLDGQVSPARDKILRCQFCLAGSGCAQTLMLLTLVVANVLSLFENSCGPADDEGASGIDSGCVMGGPSPISGSSTPGSSDLRHGLPSTTRALMLGDLPLNESVKRAFSRRLVRMYLDRQRRVVRQLHQLLRRTEGDNTSFKVTEDLLQDVRGRVERFIGFITLTTRLE
ncbi:Zn(II)2Cys6 transcription factor domain-containing protein [Aspergillus clavatus NRRL 1]|uniref:C6 zinc finger domain protein n=1 Tax=Aspergillus clavatus (strain ATCC 1007 / CBS 513.65 / DSM 816 / NCTC 3887 / NRRL 1 / QM 1276 / 107) TaxID=344612 RepID=A1CDW7_ASPCL|nr:C6 zinc finger domain protein [Aspergillus clavatus NRRL 1]EAW12044.1 C6 zinc finger domain protein [Aspergillus clavatus NRRL 1]